MIFIFYKHSGLLHAIHQGDECPRIDPATNKPYEDNFSENFYKRDIYEILVDFEDTKYIASISPEKLIEAILET